MLGLVAMTEMKLLETVMVETTLLEAAMVEKTRLEAAMVETEEALVETTPLEVTAMTTLTSPRRRRCFGSKMPHIIPQRRISKNTHSGKVYVIGICIVVYVSRHRHAGAGDVHKLLLCGDPLFAACGVDIGYRTCFICSRYPHIHTPNKYNMCMYTFVCVYVHMSMGMAQEKVASKQTRKKKEAGKVSKAKTATKGKASVKAKVKVKKVEKAKPVAAHKSPSKAAEKLPNKVVKKSPAARMSPRTAKSPSKAACKTPDDSADTGCTVFPVFVLEDLGVASSQD